MDDIKSAVNRVTVTIFNEEYVVKGEENPEYMENMRTILPRSGLFPINNYLFHGKAALH